jgi:alpha-N-acetylglucosamine transferase
MRFVDLFVYLKNKASKLITTFIFRLQRVILLDSDMMLLKSMDSLMDLELPSDWIAANHACTCNPTKMDIYPPDW